MKVKDLIKQMNRDVEDSYSNADIIDWFNRCLDDLTPIAKKEAKTSFTITSTNKYTLPADLHKIAYVFVNGEEYERVSQRDFNSVGYKVWNGELSLQNGPDSGAIDLLYYKKLKHVTASDLEEEPEIPAEFHDLLILYAVGHYQFTEEEYDDRPDALQRYERRKQQFAQHVNRDQDDVYEIRVV